jgi:hypothetical protein
MRMWITQCSVTVWRSMVEWLGRLGQSAQDPRVPVVPDHFILHVLQCSSISSSKAVWCMDYLKDTLGHLTRAWESPRSWARNRVVRTFSPGSSPGHTQPILFPHVHQCNKAKSRVDCLWFMHPKGPLGSFKKSTGICLVPVVQFWQKSESWLHLRWC